MTADDMVAKAGDSLFAPQSIQDVRDRLARIEAAGCPCVESPHLNALHDLAHDDVPVLLAVIEDANLALRQAKRQIEAYLDDGDRNRLIVALATIDRTGSEQ